MYLLDNAAPQAPERFDALGAIFDPWTKRHLEALGIADGCRCLEVGAGGGSIARWIADRVGPRGHVLATDIDPRHVAIDGRTNLEVRRHDVAAEPLPEGAFDVVHARLVLMHLPDAGVALSRMIAALAPGGRILIEDFDAPVGAGTHPHMLRTSAALRQVFADGGVQLDAGHSLAARLRAGGLQDVDAEARAFLWAGGSAGSRLMRANFEQLRDRLIGSGLLTAREFEDDLARLDDPAVTIPSPVMWAAWGSVSARSRRTRGTA
jgi:SAM-dependent methyltransferase